MSMLTQKHSKTLQKEYGRAGFNFFQRVLEPIKMNFSGRYNGLYGIADVALLLMYMCKGSTYAEQAVHDRNHDNIAGPGADWLLSKIPRSDFDAMLHSCTLMLRKTIRYLARLNMIPIAPIVKAIDFRSISQLLQNLIVKIKMNSTHYFNSTIKDF